MPKWRVNNDGSRGESNNISLAGLNHKLGQRATTNCLLNLGEQGDCVGHLVGEAHRGLSYMFHMMNEARIGVGNKWAIQILGGYGYTRDYPVERFYHDKRLNHIHEGTFAIQGLNLLGREILGDGGRAPAVLTASIN